MATATVEPGPIAGARGFLFCDLRGYAAFVEREGDRAAAELLETYRRLVREVIAGYEGAEIRTEGDSFYVVFATASAAVEAGLGIVQAAAAASTLDRPVRVGVGIHAGETIATAEGPVGGAVNIAARVCARAQAGEVLVTETVRALTRTVLPHTFAALGTVALKGIPGGIPLYRVEAVSTGRAHHLRRRLGVHRRLVAGVAALLALVLVGGAAAWAVNRPPDCLTPASTTKDVVARIDPARMCVVELIPVGRRPDAIVASGDAIWVANEEDWTVARIDASAGSVERWLGVPGPPVGLAVHPDGQVDVLAGARSQIAGSAAGAFVLVHPAQDDRLVAGDDLPLTPGIKGRASWTAIAASEEWTWVAGTLGALHRLAYRGGDRQRSVWDPTGKPSWVHHPVAAARGSTVWIADGSEPYAYRFDGLADMPRQVALGGSAGSRAATATAGEIWLLRTDPSLTRIDAASGVPSTIALDGPASGLAVAPDALWLLDDGAARAVHKVDPKDGRTVGSVPVGGVPGGAIYAGGSLWVTVHAP